MFLLFGGLLAMVIRWQWAFPGQRCRWWASWCCRRSDGVVSPSAYTPVFTMHGLVMIFFAVTPLLIGAFGNLTIPLMIGARDMAFPRLNMLSFWTFVASLVLVTVSFFVAAGLGLGRLDHLPAAGHPGGHARAGPDAGGGGAVRHRRRPR